MGTNGRRRSRVRAGWCVPWRSLCGFHIYDYAQLFHTSCARVLGTGGAEGVTEGNEGIFDHRTRRSTAVDAFPIGIDPQIFRDKLQTGPVKDKIIELQRRFDGKKVGLGIGVGVG